MKLLYATLASSALAAKPLMMFLEDQVDQIFPSTNPGEIRINLPPYLIVEVDNYGLEGKIQTSADGENMNVDNWVFSGEQESATLRAWGTAYGSNLAQMGGKSGFIVDQVYYDENCVASGGAEGVTFDCERNAVVEFKDGEKGDMKETVDIFVDFAQTGKSVAVDIVVDADRVNSNLQQLEEYDVYSLAKPYTLDISSTITVADPNKCYDWTVPGCSIVVENSIDAPTAGFSAQPKVEFYVKAFAIVVKAGGKGIDGKHVAFLRKVDRNGSALALSKPAGWWSLHYAEGSNWQKAVRNNDDYLLGQVPTGEQWNQDAYPELLKFLTPFRDLVVACHNNTDKMPYLVWYMDDLFATFDTDFDCSDYVRAGKVESDLLADIFEVESFNDYMADKCVEMNQAIVDTLQCPELDAFMGMMRDYVTEMSSDDGFNTFKNIFGSVF